MRACACSCMLVRQGVSVSALCNAALECHVCHPSPQLSGTADRPSTERERRRRAAPLHAWANFTLSCSAKPESTLPRPSQIRRHEMKNKCYVYMSVLLLCTYVTSAVRTFSASLDLQPKNSRQQMAADEWKVACRFVESKCWPKSTSLENSYDIRQFPLCERLLYFFCLQHFSESGHFNTLY